MNNENVKERRELRLKVLSTADFLNFGAQHIAYIKPVDVEGKQVFSVHAADGTALGMTDTTDMAHVIIRQNDMFAVMLQ